MIADPIEFDGPNCPTYDQVKQQSQGTFIFVIRDGEQPYLGYLKHFTALDPTVISFAIVKYGNRNCHYITGINGQLSHKVSREAFADFVRENHPDHFEWLLFHPEWLE